MSEKTILILLGSPRENGNSVQLAKALERGALEAGHVVKMRFLQEHLQCFLRDCRTCRKKDGECSIEDGYKELFFDDFLPSEGVVFATPTYWYGVSGQTKTFFDRTFCYYAASYPHSDEVIKGMSGKKIGLLCSSEETYPGATLGMVHQIQEYSRYTQSEFMGVVRGIGNKRNEVGLDPMDPLKEAEKLGRLFFSDTYSDYRIHTDRPGSVWGKKTHGHHG